MEKKTYWNSGNTKLYYGTMLNLAAAVTEIVKMSGSETAKNLFNLFKRRAGGFMSKKAKDLAKAKTKTSIVSLLKNIIPIDLVKTVWPKVNYGKYIVFGTYLVSYIGNVIQAQIYINKIRRIY